jgi:hypothetical protein
MKELGPDSECVRSCEPCPVKDMGDPERLAVNALCAMYGLDGSPRWGGAAQMETAAEELVDWMGGESVNGAAVATAADKIINDRSCHTTRWYLGV